MEQSELDVIWNSARKFYNEKVLKDETYDLRKGLAGARPHDPEDYITKITAVSPSDKGKDI